MTKNGTNQFPWRSVRVLPQRRSGRAQFLLAQQHRAAFNDFGWDVGGPIKKNKIFFFLGEEWKRLRQQSAPSRYSLPTNAELQGNFAGTGHTIDDPGTKTPYPGDLIPASAITADGKAIANVYRTVIADGRVFTKTSRSPITPLSKIRIRSITAKTWAASITRSATSTTLRFRSIDDYNSIYLATGPGGNLPIRPEIRNRPARAFCFPRPG